ncbi:hypothetical protein FXO38_35113 [Capsicum annuum]|nr:hypothetical protein FXO38_35113 [Capsicum annuum]
MDEHTAKTPINSGTRNMKLVYDASSFSLELTQEDLVITVSNPLQLRKSGISKEIRSKFCIDEVKMTEILKRKGLKKTPSPKEQKTKKQLEKKRKSKEIEDKVMQDEIFLVRKLSRFTPHMCLYSDNDIYGSIRAILNKEQFKNFCENNIFGYFMKKKQCVVQAQLCRCVLTLEVKGSSSSGIMISANGISLSFTPMKFAIIIELNCVSNRYDYTFDKGVPNRMIEKYFNGAEIIQKRQLFLAFSEKVWGENNDEDAEKFAILYFLHSFVLSNIDTVVIPHLHFDLVDSGRYKDFPWGSLSFEDLARSLNNRLKDGGKFYLIQGMSLTIQVWLYECCSNVPPKIALKVENRIPRLLNWKTIVPHLHYEFLMNAMFKNNDKVVFKNIEPTEIEMAKLEIPKKDVTEDERSVDSDDDFQDPPPKKINRRSKKKQKMDSSTPVANKTCREKASEY